MAHVGYHIDPIMGHKIFLIIQGGVSFNQCHQLFARGQVYGPFILEWDKYCPYVHPRMKTTKFKAMFYYQFLAFLVYKKKSVNYFIV